MFNLVIVPGLAVPTGSTIYMLFKSKLHKLAGLLQNFYNLKHGDFFIILLLQQLAFNILGSFTQLGILRFFYFSPTAFLLSKRKKRSERAYLKDIHTIFDIGYTYSMNLVILGIVFIYS